MDRRSSWPTPERGPDAVRFVIAQATQEGRLGYDIEYSPQGPTIIGVASLERCAAWWWDEELGNLVFDAGVPIAAHSGLSADRPVSEKALRRGTPSGLWRDTMVLHWMANPDLASVPKSLINNDGDSDAGAVLGMMNLWATTSLLHDIPQWKECVGAEECLRDRRPCPDHNELDYCAVDSWAGLVDDYSLEENLRNLGVPESYYTFRARVTEYCHLMQQKGFRVDQDVIDGLEAAIQSKKATLFPARISSEGKPFKNGKPRLLTKPRKIWEGPFNPNSGDQVIKWFLANGIELKARGGKASMGKDVVLKALAKELKPYGLTFNVASGEVETEFDSDVPALPEHVDMLLHLAQKTCAGKGLASWFDPKYILNGEVHARFNSCATSTSRLSSSKPNATNIPRVGFGAQVKKAIVPRPGMKFLDSDFSQLEFRICLWAAGLDPNLADGAFEMLVERSKGQFEEAAQRLSWKPRDVAKSAIHGCLTGDHEVLTPNGWVRIDEWQGQDIATWHSTETITFQQPAQYHKYDFDGILESIEGRAISTVCTSNHGFPVWVDGTWQGRQYHKLRKSCVADFPRTGKISVGGVLAQENLDISDDDIRRAVAVQADANLTKYSARFHIVKPRKKERLKLLFPDAEQKLCTCHPSGIRMDVKKFSSILLDAEKNFTPVLFQLSVQQREVFLNEILLWDGSVKANSRVYDSTNKHNIDMVQALAHLSGREALIRPWGEKENSYGSKQGYRLSFNRRKYVGILEQTFTQVPYTGKVYCFTTASGYFVVRRKDRVHVTGNSDYMEGLSLRTAQDLSDARACTDRRAGALFVYDGKDLPEWSFRGSYVCFTGANLSERLFGDRTRANRARALAIQQIYLDAFPQIREFQRKVSSEIEHTSEVRLPSGHRVPLYGRSKEDDLKYAAALWGQGCGAIYSQEGMLRFADRGDVMLVQVHDNFLFEVPEDWTDEYCMEWMRPMVAYSDILKGFTCPAKCKTGRNWKETKEIGTLRCTT